MSDNYIDIGDLQVDTIVGHPELEDLEITPTIEEQEFNHDESYGYDKVSVSAVDHTIDNNITAENIKSGIEILGVEGSVVELAGEEITINPSTSEQVITPSQNKNGITRATVNPVPLETKSITPSTSEQTITPSSGKMGISQVNVSAVDNTIDNNIQAGNIKKDTTILGITGTYEGLKGEEVEITPTTSQQIITPSEGKNGITKATVKAVSSSIDANIQSSNIKSGVSILGVNGSVQELNGEQITITPTTSQQVITPTSGKNAITQATVEPVPLETKTITPTTSQQTITPTSGKMGISEATVEAVTSSIDQNIQAGNIKKDVSILGVTGTLEGAGKFKPTFLSYGYSPRSTANYAVGAYMSDIPSIFNDIQRMDLSELEIFKNCFRGFAGQDGPLEEFPNIIKNTINGKRFDYMFAVGNIKFINLKDFTSHSTEGNFRYMFNQNTSVEHIDIRNLDTSNIVPVMEYGSSLNQYSNMFSGCYKLARIDMDKIDFSINSNTKTAKVFQNCGLNLETGTYTMVYVKNKAMQDYILGMSSTNRPSGWSTANVIIAGSEDDHRTD